MDYLKNFLKEVSKLSVIIFLLSIPIKIWMCFTQPFSYDELLTIESLQINELESLLVQATKFDLQKEITYRFLYFLKTSISTNPEVWRTIFLLLNVLSLGILFNLKEKKNKDSWIDLYIIFTSLNFSSILFSYEIRPYSLLLTEINLFIFFLYRGRNWDIYYQLFFAILMAQTHLLGVFFLFFFWLDYLIRKIPKKEIEIGKTFILSAVVGLVFLNSFNEVYGHINIDHVYRYLGFREIFHEMINVFTFIIPFFLFVALLFGSKKRIKEDFFLFLIVLGLPTLFLIKSLITTPLVYPRYYIFIQGPLLVLISKNIFDIKNKYSLLRSAIILITLVYLIFYRQIFRSFRADSEYIAKLAIEIGQKENLPIYSCDVCFTPYMNHDSRYLCIDGSRSSKVILPKRFVLIYGVNPASGCGQLYFMKNKPQNIYYENQDWGVAKFNLK